MIGAAVFPVGLILVVLAGAELITGNMMSVAMALFSRKISVKELAINWGIVTVMNLIGALFVAYFFGHLVGLTETGPYLEKTVAVAQGKLDMSFGKVLISGIGCNWLVCLAVWLSFGAQDAAGKILGIWFPIMAFVAIGFQHVVANMFVIPAAIFAGSFTWGSLSETSFLLLSAMSSAELYLSDSFILLHTIRKTAQKRNEAGIMTNGQIHSMICTISVHF